MSWISFKIFTSPSNIIQWCTTVPLLHHNKTTMGYPERKQWGLIKTIPEAMTDKWTHHRKCSRHDSITNNTNYLIQFFIINACIVCIMEPTPNPSFSLCMYFYIYVTINVLNLNVPRLKHECEWFMTVVVLLCLCQMAYVTEIRLSAGRGAWTGVAQSSCPEVDLEVIEEYLQEHSLEVQPVHTPASPLSTVGQQMHTHQATRIIGRHVGVAFADSVNICIFLQFVPDCVFDLFLCRE